MDKKLVLIIEDDKFFQALVSKRLINEGFDVITASDSKEALKVLEEKKPALILLDLILPLLSGFEILSIIKKDERTKDIPVIVLSNLGQKEEVEKAMALGAKDFMIKVNFTPEEIVRKVKSVT
ncbi:response regulator [Patescibacteria group bacterium]|nr:response regulator [Patescibacteria group bacterium]